MSSTSLPREGVNILPIPPALVFPYPQSTESFSKQIDGHIDSTTSPNDNSISEIKSATAHGGGDPHEQVNAEANAEENAKANAYAKRPTASRAVMTERPAAAARKSWLGIRRHSGSLPVSHHGQRHEVAMSPTEKPEDGAMSRRVRFQRAGTSEHPSHRPRAARRGATVHHDSNPYARFAVQNDGFASRGHVSRRDGRLNISLHETNNRGYLAKTFGPTVERKNTLDNSRTISREAQDTQSPHQGNEKSVVMPSDANISCPKLNIVIMVIGSRGDIQPFLRLGKLLKAAHGHRVRIATHPTFKTFVEQDSGLEFFSVGGDPSELMAFMVKNPGLVPRPESIRAGELGRRREAMYGMFKGFWRACVNATDDETDLANLKMMGEKDPFVADVIIANPPSFAHVHCAERLGIPLHLTYTFPNTPTQQFPHPLTNIKQSNVDANYTNFMSYPLVELMIWQGLGDLINRFRVHTLGLDPISPLWASGQLYRLKVPYTYLWSPGLFPKPADWGPEQDITGFVFLDLASSFKPPQTLVDFLEAGEPPVYIGFGSIVVDDPDKFTALIFDAVRQAGVRALVSKGWGGLGAEEGVPSNVFLLDNTPHDWLFPRVSAIVHHGGAGTTAIGLKCGRPTMIVPFFGDQPFWGAMVAKAGAGVEPVPYKQLTSEKLASGITRLLTREVQANAASIQRAIEREGDGAVNAVASFHRSLPLSDPAHDSSAGDVSWRCLRCSVLPNRVAVWEVKRTSTPIRLCALAADILVEQRQLRWTDLRLLRHCDWTDLQGPGEPLTGGGSALLRSVAEAVSGVGGVPWKWARSVKRKEKHERHKHRQKKKDLGSVPEGNESTTTASGQESGHVPLEKSGALAHGGQHGAEKDLPPGNMGDGPLKDVVSADHPNQLRSPRLTRRSSASSAASTSSSSTSSSASDIAHNLLEDTKHSFSRTGAAIAKAPMDVTLALAQGFHNAPRLYGDPTVRTPVRVSGIRSGLRAAGSELAYGAYDGVTGVVRLPILGAKERGVAGAVKGVGWGMGGLVLKNLAAVIGAPAYVMKGVHKEVVRRNGGEGRLRTARMVQGLRERQMLLQEGHEDASEAELTRRVQERWREMRAVGDRKEGKASTGKEEVARVAGRRRLFKKHAAMESKEGMNASSIRPPAVA